MQKYWKLMIASEGVKQTLITVFGNIGATGISAITLILISRTLGPHAFGEFSVGFAIILILNKANDVGLTAALLRFIPQASSDEEINQIFWYTVKIKLYLSLLFIIVGLIISPYLTAFLNLSSSTIIYASFLLSIFSTWYEQLLAMLQGLHRFTQAVLANTLQSSTKLIGISIFLLSSLKSSDLFFSFYMAAPIVPLILSPFLFGSRKWITVKPISDNTKQQMWSLAKHAGIGFVAAGIIENIDVLFVQSYLTSYETGLLGGVSKVSMMLSLIGYSLGNVLNPRVARYKSKTDLEKYYKKAFLVFAFVIIGYLAFVPLAKYLLIYTVGPDYLPGISVLYILGAASFLTIATIPFLALFYSFKADWYFSVSGLVQLVIIIIGNYFFVPSYGLEATAWTRLISRITLCVLTVCLATYFYSKKNA